MGLNEMGNMSHNCIPDCLKYCWLFIFVFQKAFPFMLITYYSKMADYTFANRDEIFIFFSLPDPFWWDPSKIPPEFLVPLPSTLPWHTRILVAWHKKRKRLLGVKKGDLIPTKSFG